MNQSKNNVPIINQKPIHIAPVPFLIGMVGFSLWLVSLFRELSLFAVYFPSCHSARSQRRSRRIHIPKLTLALRERGDRCRRWLRAGEEHFHTLLTRTRENLLQRKKVFFRSWIQLPSATNDDPRRIPESVFSFFHIRVKVYLLWELKEYEKYRTI